MAEEPRDLELERLLKEGVPLLYEADEAEFGDVEDAPVPLELRDRILNQAREVGAHGLQGASTPETPIE